MNGFDICKRAAEWEGYKYWYGGKGEIASVALANRLRKENPATWTDSYYNKALKDIDGKQRVGDCSGLVCHAYDIGIISSYQIERKYQQWHDQPKNGMILWRTGHVGIYDSGKVRELRGIDYDYCFNDYNPAQWTKTLYDPNVVYATGIKVGWTQENCKWLYSKDGVNYLKNVWERINNHWYYFGNDGYALTGSQIVDGKRCYFATLEDSVDFECALMVTDENGYLDVWHL